MAPIILKDYSFIQNDEFLTIRLPFKRSLSGKPDIFTYKNYLKVSYFDLFIFQIP